MELEELRLKLSQLVFDLSECSRQLREAQADLETRRALGSSKSDLQLIALRANELKEYQKRLSMEAAGIRDKLSQAVSRTDY